MRASGVSKDRQRDDDANGGAARTPTVTRQPMNHLDGKEQRKQHVLTLTMAASIRGIEDQ